ncbi:MAG: antitoxin [Methylobacter sp.]|nr:antitoxin [Methylobacter sp.]
MKAEYDLSQMKSRKNPYTSKLKKSVTIRLGEDVVGYFKEMAEGTGVPLIKGSSIYIFGTVCASIGQLIFLGSQSNSKIISSQ